MFSLQKSGLASIRRCAGAREVLAVCGLLCSALVASPVTAQSPEDPLGSPSWETMHMAMLGGEPVVFDERVEVLAPTAAENPANVPVLVRVAPLSSPVERVVVFADLNPIQKVLEFRPEGISPSLGLRLKLEQASPIRAAARTADGVWHVGGTWVDAAGGGCTAPSVGRVNGNWADTLGDVRFRAWRDDERISRVRLRVMHPMDTGLAPGIPAFYIHEMQLHDGDRLLGTLLTNAPISENPFFTFDFPAEGEAVKSVQLSGRDINGNRFEAVIN